MIRNTSFALVLGWFSFTAIAHDGIEPRIGLQSPEVIKQSLRQMGIKNAKVQLRGNHAIVRIQDNGRAAIVRYGRMEGRMKILQADTALRRKLLRLIPRQILIRKNSAPALSIPARPTLKPVR